ncbi:MAG: hypothetical protein FJX67_05715 [Alphaproteobacteria bacterium]|nr:hypothetical protein [Alphaproteobacteria bacterium]
MPWQAAALGLLLGIGVLLAVQGFAAVSDKARSEPERKKGMLKLNAGIVCAAVSMYLFSTMGG